MVILFNSSPQPCCCCWIWTLSFMLLQQPLRREPVSRLFHRVVRLFSYLLSFVVYFPLTTSMVEAGMLHKQRSEEHTSELQSLMRISYAVFCLKTTIKNTNTIQIL